MCVSETVKASVYADSFYEGINLVLASKDGTRRMIYMTVGEAEDLSKNLKNAIDELEGPL